MERSRFLLNFFMYFLHEFLIKYYLPWNVIFFYPWSFWYLKQTVTSRYEKKQNYSIFFVFCTLLRFWPRTMSCYIFYQWSFCITLNVGRNVGIDVWTFRWRSTGRFQCIRGYNGESGFYVAAGWKFGTLASAGTRKARVVPHRAKSERHPRSHDELWRVSNSGKKKEIIWKACCSVSTCKSNPYENC